MIMRTLAIIMLLLTMSGCNNMFYVGYPEYVFVDSYGSDESLNKKSCYVECLLETENNLQYEEFYGYLKNLLEYKGYNLVKTKEEANVIIYFNYGIGNPDYQYYTKLIPIIGQTGVSSVTNMGNVYLNPYTNSIGYNQSTYNRPMYGITGYQNMNTVEVNFLKFIDIVAYDLYPEPMDLIEYTKYIEEHNGEAPPPRVKKVWQVFVDNHNKSNDLRKFFFYMLSGAGYYVGKSSGERRQIKIYDYDPYMYIIRGLQPVSRGKK